MRAKDPFVKWINSLPDPAVVSVEQVNRDNTAYLLPEYSYDYEEEELLADFDDLILEASLNSTKRETSIPTVKI